MAAIGVRLLVLCLLLAFAAATCCARSTMNLSGGDELKLGRSLKMISVNDYSDATANHGHDPRNRNGGGNGNGHRTHDIP